MYKDKNKKILLEQLKKTPVVQVACQKLGISRATYYRWRQNQKFAADADRAILEGSQMINDMAESQLIQAIQERNLSAIQFWLRHHHRAYGMKLELSGTLGVTDTTLTDEQKKLVRKAVRLAAKQSTYDENDRQPDA